MQSLYISLKYIFSILNKKQIISKIGPIGQIDLLIKDIKRVLWMINGHVRW